MKKNTTALMILTLTTLTSCAGIESFQDKMSRYTPAPTVAKNHVPQIESQGFEFKARTKRTPANLGATQLESVGNDETTLSNKKLYFLALFGQYENLKPYAQNFSAPSLNICPQFHTSLLEHKGRRPAAAPADISVKALKKFSYDFTQLHNPGYIAMRPELFLSLSKDEPTPRVIDLFRSEGAHLTEEKMNDYVLKALDIHLANSYSEVRELCEYGVSDNYYIYENLITHIKSGEFGPAEKNMNILLKTTIFSNMALVTAIEKTQADPMRSIASTNEGENKGKTSYANEVMARLNVEWAKEYFNYLKTSK